MKYLKYFLFVGVVFLSSSFTTRTSGISEGFAVGSAMPEITVSDEIGNGLSLEGLRGKKILVNFWAAYDAESHLQNVQLWNTLQQEKSDLIMISVSFDESKSVFEKTLAIDGIGKENHFNEAKGSESEIYKKCRLNKGFGSYLIDETGIIIAKNLTPTDLKKLMKV